MINPAAAMKVMKAKNQFVSNHPKFAAFFRNVLTGGVQEGTIIDEDAERYIGKKAAKNRKIYNGMMKTYFYMFPGPKPPRRKKPEQAEA